MRSTEALSLRHLERFLALAWQSGATPVILITKSDAAPPSVVTKAVEAVKAGGRRRHRPRRKFDDRAKVCRTWRPTWSKGGRSRCLVCPGPGSRRS